MAGLEDQPWAMVQCQHRVEHERRADGVKATESESPLLSNYLFGERKNDRKAAVLLGRTAPCASLALHEASHFHWKVEEKSVAGNGLIEKPARGRGALPTCIPF